MCLDCTPELVDVVVDDAVEEVVEVGVLESDGVLLKVAVSDGVAVTEALPVAVPVF